MAENEEQPITPPPDSPAREGFRAKLRRMRDAIAAFLARHWIWGLAVALVGSVLFLWLLPKYQRNPTLTTPAQIEAEDRHRATIAQILGGLFLLAGGYITWRRLEVAQKGLEVAREGQITERFTRAIDQLGAVDEADKTKKLEIRLGGIYALEQIAKDSETFYWPIIEILTAYVRENSKIPKDEDGNPDYDKANRVTADIQAILTVIGRRARNSRKGEDRSLNLGRTNLCGAILEEAELQNALLDDANLANAFLSGANLQVAFIEYANLRGAILDETNLKYAILHGADLRGVIGLTQDQIDSAKGDETTKLPDGIVMPESWKKKTATA